MLENMDLRFPIGPEIVPSTSTAEQRAEWIEGIAETPSGLWMAVGGLTDAQLDTPYREGGWTVRQVVHHLSDSHIHAYIRMKAALTEDNPPVRGYDEAKYAQLPDYRLTPVDTSIGLLELLHERWVVLLRELTPADFERTFLHSERGVVRLDQQLASYAWHGRHHLAHISALRTRMQW